MINRLQFRHHNEVFNSKEDAREYIYSQIRFAESGLSVDNRALGYSLLAEPTILLYKNEEDETSPHLMLAIGSQTNESVQYSDNRFCIIDIDATEQEIVDLEEKLDKAIKSLTLIALSSDTLNFYSNKTDDGTYVSGDVKVADAHIFDDVRYKNNLMVTPEGLFIYVNLTYDEAAETFTFTVSNADGTLSNTSVKLPNNYLVSGHYDERDESIHLQMKEGEEVIVDCEKLIDEWGVEGDASSTPVVLTKEEIDYGISGDSSHYHTEPWQDVLRADVRIKDETKVLQQDGTYKYVKDENSTNILNRTNDGRYLYVDGKASNIIYYMNGEKSTVKAALDELQNIKLSSDSDNILINKVDGFFASSKLEYISSANKLIFKTSGHPDKEIQLNSVELFERVYYDPTREVLVLTYKDSTGQTQFVEVPIGEMIRDWEWEPLNEGHNVKIVKKRNVAGNDKVSADVKIYDDPDNILVDKNHELFVKGTADNIKYENGTVKDALVDLKATDAALDNKINIEIARAEAAEQVLDNKIGDGFGPRNTVRDEIDREKAEREAADEALQNEINALSAETSEKLQDINGDNSINIDKTEPTIPVISVNLSEEVEHDKENIIKLNNDGLYAGVDLSYIEEANKLIFSTTNGSKEIQLESMSSIISIEYNPNKEAIVITYMTNGHEVKTVEIPVGDLINEWRIWDGHEGAVQLEKIRIASGTSEQDILKAGVVINSAHTDNILVNDSGSLYVPGAQIEQNRQDIADLNSRMTTAESDINVLESQINSVSGNLASEISRSITEDEKLASAITKEISDREQADAELADALRDSKLIFDDTTSIDFNDPYIDNNHVKAEVKVQGGDNIIKIGQGLYATATLEYEPTGNKLRLVTSNGAQEYIQLVGATLLDSIDYDPVNKMLIIRYTDGTGSQRETSVGVTDLWNEWIVQNPSEKSAVEMTKTIGDPGNLDTISSRVLITDDRDEDGKPDDGSTNVIEIKNNGLFVDGTPIEEAKKTAECVKNEIKVFEKAVIGHIIGEECGSGYTYEPNNIATYINSATSFNNADLILDINLNRVENYVNEVSAKTDCVDAKANKTYEILYGPSATMPECGEGAVYQPYVGACIISGATSFNEADHLLNDQICEILTMWVSGKTCSTESAWVEDGANRRLQTDVRISRGRFAEMTDDDVYIEDLTGGYIDPTTNEFTDTNVLRIACINEEPSGTTPSIDSMQNGIYLSNVWDCGLYYDASTPADQEAKGKAQAAGYNTNYSTDDDSSARNYNYMNNVRQNDIPHN